MKGESAYPSYPAYKDSGVDWLGPVPEAWEAMPLKRLALLKSGESINSDSIDDLGTYPVFGGNGLRGYTKNFTHEGFYPLIGRQGALCGNVQYARGRFWASEHAVVASPLKQVDTYWLGELLRTMDLNQYSVSAAQPGLSVDMIGNLRIPVPSVQEQKAIAAFIGRETAKIDTLIAKQERMIALLNEKRQAVISHAVTKGLNLAMPMKDSETDWSGKVPDGWAVGPLKLWIDSIEQGWSPECEGRLKTESEWGVLRVGCVNSGRVDVYDHKALPSHLEPKREFTVRVGDFLVSRANTRELVGSAAIVEDEMTQLIFSDKLFRVKTKSNLDKVFLLFIFMSRRSRAWIELNTSGASASMQNIGQQTIREMPVAIPSMAEQKALVSFLQDYSANTHMLIAKTSQSIELMKEHRAALISAAVTGKIDVRQIAA